MSESQSCETMMQSEESGDIPATPAAPKFEISPAAIVTAVVADVLSGPSHPAMQQEIELEVLDSSPPTHLLNSQFLN